MYAPGDGRQYVDDGAGNLSLAPNKTAVQIDSLLTISSFYYYNTSGRRVLFLTAKKARDFRIDALIYSLQFPLPYHKVSISDKNYLREIKINSTTPHCLLPTFCWQTDSIRLNMNDHYTVDLFILFALAI